MAQITYADKSALNQNAGVADANKCNATDLNQIKSAVNTNTPVGSIMIYAGDTAPSGWLICDGSEISRTTYANLFNAIGIAYGNGDGSTTFNLPNLKGRIPVGQDTSDTDLQTIGTPGGEKTHQLTIDEMPSHTHRVYYYVNINLRGGVDHLLAYGSPNSSGLVNYKGTTWIGNEGGDQAHNNMQPYVVMNYIISY